MRPDSPRFQRREFFQAAATASAAAISWGNCSSSATEPNPPLPTRRLGKTGFEVTIATVEASQPADSLGRLLRLAYANGVRSFDTADCYASSEQSLATWMHASPRVRETIFLSTKDHPRAPSEMEAMLDRRLAALKLDRVDLFYLHNLGSRSGAEEAVALLKSQAFEKAVRAMKSSGKARLVGFSTHHREQARLIDAAAERGFIDVILLDYPFGRKQTSTFNRALDLAHRRGIGLIANGSTLPTDSGSGRDVSTLQAALHAIWMDERISSCSLSLRNTKHIRDVVSAARSFHQADSGDPG